MQLRPIQLRPMQQRHKIYHYILLIAFCAGLVVAGTVLAAGEVLTRSAITIAGGQALVNGIEARSAVGQPVAGIISSAAGEMCAGLMCPGSGSTQGVPLTTPTSTPTVSTTPSSSPTPNTSVTPTATPTPTSTPPSTGNGANVYLPLVVK